MSGRSPPLCVCVFFPFFLDIEFVGRISRGHTGGRSHRISHPPSFCGAWLNFSRGKDSAFPFPRRPCSRFLCTNDLIFLHLLGIFLFFKYFNKEKSWLPGFELTSQRVRRLRASPSQGGKISKRLGGIIGCKYKTSSWHLNGFSDGSNIGSTL